MNSMQNEESNSPQAVSGGSLDYPWAREATRRLKAAAPPPIANEGDSNPPHIYHFEEPRNGARDYVLAALALVALIAALTLLFLFGQEFAAFVEEVQE